MSTSFAFRIDAGAGYGWGHLMRCLALAHELRRLGARVVWLCRHTADGPLGYLVWQGYEVVALPVAGSSEEDAELTRRALKQAGIQPDWLIVDHYDLDWKWEARVGCSVRRVMVIDDVAARHHQCDLLLDQTAPVSSASYCADYITLRGPGYALIRQAFRDLRIRSLKRRQRQGQLRRILLSFGSEDHMNMIRVALAGIDRSGFRGRVDVVVGQSARQWKEVARLAHGMPCEAVIYAGTDDLAPLMYEADLAIGAGGMTAWERCALGLPTLLITTAANQRRAVQTLQAAGAVDYVGPAEHVQAQTIATRIDHYAEHPDLLVSMGRRAATLCDGLGAARIALHLVPLLAKDGTPVTLRRVTPADSDQVYDWQRMPETRRYARNPQAPEYEEHRRWFAERLGDPHCIFHLVEHGGRAVGVVRLDLVEERATYEVSIFVDPSMQRRGIAAAALAAARRVLPNATFIAHVLPENAASRRLFEKSGYMFDPERQMYVHRPSEEGSEMA